MAESALQTGIFTVDSETGDRKLKITDISIWNISIDEPNDRLIVSTNSERLYTHVGLNTFITKQ